jgi:choline kinase
MHAIILAAGVGQRLGAVAGDMPKCLLEFAGQSLLERHLIILDHYGIERLTVVTGYQSQIINAVLTNTDVNVDISTRHNPDYRAGSVVSLACTQDTLCSGEPILLMDADVLYDHRLIERLLTTKHGNCFLLDRNFEPGEEPVKLCVLDGQLIDFRKRIDKNLIFDFQGESVGFFRFEPETARNLAATAQSYVVGGRQEEAYEEVIRDHLLASPSAFGYEDITGIPWIEIDFPDDIERARRTIIPNLTRLSA